MLLSGKFTQAEPSTRSNQRSSSPVDYLFDRFGRLIVAWDGDSWLFRMLEHPLGGSPSWADANGALS